MHTESKNYDFLIYTLMLDNQCQPSIPSTTVVGDTHKATVVFDHDVIMFPVVQLFQSVFI